MPAFHASYNSCGGKRELVAGAIPKLQVGGFCSFDRFWQIDVRDQLTSFQSILDVRRISGKLVELRNRNDSFPLGAFDMDHRFQRGHRHAHV